MAPQTLPRRRDRVLSMLDRYWEDLRRLGLFGSAAREESTNTSDLDFVVDLERKTFDCYMDAKLFLEELFGGRVDLVSSDALKPRLRDRILAEAFYAEGLPGLP